MEKMNTNIEQQEEINFESFKAEINAFREKELAGEKPTAHLISPEFNAEELAETDMEMYKKIEIGDITIEEFNEYRRPIFDNPEVGESRKLFAAYLGNLASGPIGRKQLEELRKRKAG